MMITKEEEFSYKTCPIYLVEYDLEQAKANMRFAKENRRNIREQLKDTMPRVTYYERYYRLNGEGPYERYIYLRAKSDANDLVRCKLNLDREIIHYKDEIKRLKAILKGRGVA